MAAAALYLKDPDTTRFISGSRAEAEALLGAPLPPLPDTGYEAGRAVFHVRFHPQLRSLLGRYLQAVLREIGADLPPGPARNNDTGKEQAEYEAALDRMLRSVRLTDRRHGLLNLCWLAWSREVAEGLKEIEGRVPAVKKLKYALQPLLSSFHKRLDQSVRRSLE